MTQARFGNLRIQSTQLTDCSASSGQVIVAIAGKAGQSTDELTALRRRVAEMETAEAGRKRTEEALRESERRYRLLAENLTDVILTTDMKGQPTYVSPSVTRFLGYSVEEAMARTMETSLTPASLEVAATLLRESASEQNRGHKGRSQAPPLELEMYRKDGSTAWAEMRATQLPGPNGRPAGILAVVSDITERKRAEEALRQSEAKYRDLVENINDVICAVDASGLITYASPAIESVLGYTQSQVTGRYCADFVYQEDFRAAAAAFQKIMSGHAQEHEFRVRTARGQILWVRSSSRPTFEGDRVVGLRGALTDISERKRAEQALQDGERRYRLLADNVSDVIWVIDIATLRPTYLSPSITRLLGYSVEEAMTRTLEQSLNPASIETARKALEKGLALEDAGDKDRWKSRMVELEMRHKDGSTVWTENALSFLRGPDGRVVGLVGIARDITQRRRAQEMLREVSQRYESIANHIQDGLTIIEHGKVVYLNDRACEILGCTREEVLNMTELDFLAPEDTERLHHVKQDAKKTGAQPEELEYWIIRNDGARRCIRNRYSTYDKEDGSASRLVVTSDITERKQAEELLKTAFISSPIGIYVVQDGVFKVVNSSFEELLGYRGDELLGMDSMNLVFREDRKMVRKNAVKMLKGKRASPYEFRYVTKSGASKWVMETVTSIRYQGRRAALGNFMDITELKQAEEALQESERLYRLLAENVTDVIFTTDMDLRYTYVSPSIIGLRGYTAEESMRQKSEDIFTPASLELTRKAMEEELAENSKEQGDPFRSRAVEMELYHKNGTTVWAEVKMTILHDRDGRPVGILGVMRDVSERKRAEKALRQSEERFKSIYVQSPMGIELFDSEGHLVSVNKATLELFGLPEGTEVKWFSFFDDPYVPDEVKDKLRRGDMASYEVTFDFEEVKRLYLFRTRRSGIAHFNVLVNPLGLNEKDTLTGYLVQIQDITEQKRAEQERRELEQKSFLANRLASVGMMASGIAHEINNPLTGVVGFTQLLMQKDLPSDIKYDVEIISEGAQRVASIVKRLLTFARQQKPERRYVNINDVITTNLHLRAYEMETSGIKVVTQLDPQLPGTIADSSQLQQVFLNLIINAETEMKLAHSKGNLFIKTETGAGTLQISFKDDGPGIAKENLGRIFDPFFTTREVGQGTGLGLSICHGIITEHGGRIYAESKLGKGATFVVELPIVTEPEQLSLPETAKSGSERVAGARILIVDDEPAVLQLLSRVLAEDRHHVETAGNAADALNRLKNGKYDLVLLDIKLPEMSGIELYKHLQKLSPSLAKAVIFVTGDVMGADTREFLDRTKALHLAKPFDTEQVRKEVNHILAEGRVEAHSLIGS